MQLEEGKQYVLYNGIVTEPVEKICSPTPYGHSYLAYIFDPFPPWNCRRCLFFQKNGSVAEFPAYFNKEMPYSISHEKPIDT